MSRETLTWIAQGILLAVMGYLFLVLFLSFGGQP